MHTKEAAASALQLNYHAVIGRMVAHLATNQGKRRAQKWNRAVQTNCTQLLSEAGVSELCSKQCHYQERMEIRQNAEQTKKTTNNDHFVQGPSCACSGTLWQARCHNAKITGGMSRPLRASM